METIPGDDDDGDEYPDELYDLYRNTAYSNPYSSIQRRPSRPDVPRRKSSHYPEDTTNVPGDVSPSTTTHSSLDDFEILNDAGGAMSRPRDVSHSRGTSRGRARQVDVRTVRVKVHHGEDTRYLMVSTGIMFDEFLERVREKLALRGKFKVRVRDEGDLITMGDRDDWDMAVQGCRKEARGREEDMGKLEVCVVFLVPCVNPLGIVSADAFVVGLDQGIVGDCGVRGVALALVMDTRLGLLWRIYHCVLAIAGGTARLWQGLGGGSNSDTLGAFLEDVEAWRPGWVRCL